MIRATVVLLALLALAPPLAGAIPVGCAEVQIAGDANGSCAGVAVLGSSSGDVAVTGLGASSGRIAVTGAGNSHGQFAVSGYGNSSAAFIAVSVIGCPQGDWGASPLPTCTVYHPPEHLWRDITALLGGGP